MGMRAVHFSRMDVFLPNMDIRALIFSEKSYKRVSHAFCHPKPSVVLTELTLFEPNMGMAAWVF